jgi:hypothetical protein
MVRQGDVLLVPVPSPQGATEADVGEIVLARGEKTGHAHVVRGRARTTTTGSARYLVVEESASLVHDEHDTIELAPGAYEVRRQREWMRPTSVSADERQWVND